MDFTSTLNSVSTLVGAKNLLATVQSFGESAVWSGLVQIFILIGSLLLGNIIRRKVPFMRKSLIPSALLGGMLIILLKFIPAVNDFINNDLMETITYHCLAMGFIATALKKSGGNKKTTTKAILESGVLQGSVYTMQATLGLGITILLTVVAGFPLAAGGLLLALGYGQGTGQALNYGKIYENDYGFTGGTTFGLSIAAIGFFVASIVGVVYINILRRRGKLRVLTAEDYAMQQKVEDYVGENEIPNTESVDKFSINIGLVILTYGLVYLIMWLVNINLIWGFNFLLGTIMALLVRLCINFCRKRKIIKREPTNNYLLDRISGFMFDAMIIAGVAAIDWNVFRGYWWQLLIICTVGAVATFVYIRLVANNIYKGYENEGFISMFGMLTGTASNGMILLREVDPKLETPAASNMVLSGLPSIAFGGALLLLLGYCPQGFVQSIVTLCVLFVAWSIFTVILFRNKIFRRKRKAVAVEGGPDGAPDPSAEPSSEAPSNVSTDEDAATDEANSAVSPSQNPPADQGDKQ